MQVDHRLIGDLHHLILDGLDPQKQGDHRRPLSYAVSLGLNSLPSLTISAVRQRIKLNAFDPFTDFRLESQSHT